ncbi:Endonuclease/exonuclease/phosphatase [Gossypium australe]|uniref:Endonuclease/exonuclease/phosphatase n=1 Tax=Gossypium australe TaxID=47621 RepID=A0A5B6W6I0_9ROSI|nr:Endonuclease/exonuclease/phosphatase [Gossypium australe]
MKQLRSQRIMWFQTLLYRRLPSGKPTEHNEKLMLERSWVGEPTGSSEAALLVKQHNPQLVFLIETKLDKNRMQRVKRRCGFMSGVEVEAGGSRGVFLNGTLMLLLRRIMLRKEWRFTGLYGSPYLKDKNTVWNLLRRLDQEDNYPWLVEGDFNEILYSFEKSGGV